MVSRSCLICACLVLVSGLLHSTAGEVLWVAKASAPTCSAACAGSSLINVTSEAGPACSVPMAGIPSAPATGNTGTQVDPLNAALGYVFVGSSCSYSTTAGSDTARVFGCLCQSTPDETTYTNAASGKGCPSDCTTAGLLGVNFFGLPLCLRAINARFGYERNGVCFSDGDQTTLEDPVDRYTCACAKASGPNPGAGAGGLAAAPLR